MKSAHTFAVSKLTRRRDDSDSSAVKRYVYAASIAASLVIVAAIGARTASRREPAPLRAPAAAVQSPVAAADAVRPGDATHYLRRGRLRPGLREALGALGDRLEKPGKERLVMEGTLARADEQEVPVRLVIEPPRRLRVEFVGGHGASGTLTFDEGRGGEQVSRLTGAERALIETLLYDTPERLFVSQEGRASTRFLGARFRLDDGVASNYSGPYYDIYQMTDETTAGGRATKLFYVNSDTLLVERVRYTAQRDGVPVRVEVMLGDWHEAQGQRVPGRIVRTEDGAQTFALSLTSMSAVPGKQDGSFAAQTR